MLIRELCVKFALSMNPNEGMSWNNEFNDLQINKFQSNIDLSSGFTMLIMVYKYLKDYKGVLDWRYYYVGRKVALVCKEFMISTKFYTPPGYTFSPF